MSAVLKPCKKNDTIFSRDNSHTFFTARVKVKCTNNCRRLIKLTV